MLVCQGHDMSLFHALSAMGMTRIFFCLNFLCNSWHSLALWQKPIISFFWRIIIVLVAQSEINGVQNWVLKVLGYHYECYATQIELSAPGFTQYDSVKCLCNFILLLHEEHSEMKDFFLNVVGFCSQEDIGDGHELALICQPW